MQIREIHWPKGQPAGLKINLSGQIYELVHVPDERDEFPLMRWLSNCATCGGKFYATSSQTKLTQLNRRCPLHVDPTVRVPRNRFDEEGKVVGEVRERRSTPQMTDAQLAYFELKVGDSIAKPGIAADSVRRSCRRWNNAMPERKFASKNINGVWHVVRVR